MKESRKTHMDKPCDICGDVGFEDLITACGQCSIAREHVYCMQNFMEELPKFWYCEPCRLSVDKVSLKYGEKEHFPKALTANSGTVHCDTTHSVGTRKVPDDSGKQNYNKRQKIVETAKVKFIPTEEAIALSSGSKKVESPEQRFALSSGSKKVEPPVRHNLVKSSCQSHAMESMSKSSPIGCKTFIPEFSESKVVANPSLKPPGLLKPPRNFSVKQAPQASKEFKETKIPAAPVRKNTSRERLIEALQPNNDRETSNTKAEKATHKASCASSPSMHRLPFANSEAKIVVVPVREHLSREQLIEALKPNNECETFNTEAEKATDEASCASSPSMHHLPFANLGGKFCADAEIRNFKLKEKTVLNILSPLWSYLLNPPSMDATWKGSFKILGGATPGRSCDGFQAHPPSNVHRKAYEFSKRMPAILQFKLLPRCNLWADIFEDDYPDEDDIGLYILPGDFERSKQNYVCLLEMMEMQDLVMRWCMDGVELLIFTSKQLHVDSRRLNIEYFLWGLFRHVKDKRFPLLVSNEDNSEITDMDIDMMGGKNVGAVDVVVSKESVRKPLLEVKREHCNDHDSSLGKSSSAMEKLDCPPGFKAIVRHWR